MFPINFTMCGEKRKSEDPSFIQLHGWSETSPPPLFLGCSARLGPKLLSELDFKLSSGAGAVLLGPRVWVLWLLRRSGEAALPRPALPRAPEPSAGTQMSVCVKRALPSQPGWFLSQCVPLFPQ